MSTATEERLVNRRILVVDDNPAIHEDFRKILMADAHANDELDDLEAEVFGTANTAQRQGFEIDSAFQGMEALERIQRSVVEQRKYSMAFMDVRMPPGWDGVKTTTHLLEADPDIGVVICSAYSDHTWEDLANQLGDSDRVLILKKPFDVVEVRQFAHALSRRWELAQQAKLRFDDLERRVVERTHELAAANEKLREEADAMARMDAELRMAQKLEAVGRLAAGVAHEINTPVQFVNDSVHFVRDAVTDIVPVLEGYRALTASVAAGEPSLGEARRLQAMDEAADTPYLLENIPKALDRSIEGLGRVAAIVRSMKDFAHPDAREKTPVDLNQAIRSTLMIAAGEYKYVADLTTDFGEIPEVYCYPGEINQVTLNIIVNAAHAIGDVVNGTDKRGTIGVRTYMEDDRVVVAISDSGMGIPEAIRARVYDPFFTTKEVGKGTGQGLALARSVVQERHGGTLRFATEMGQGTTFFMSLPAGA